MPSYAEKLYGKLLPEIIDPPERVCFVIEIPDTLQYRAALMGQLEWLADWRCWEHYQEDYANPPERNVEAAQLFVNAVTEAEFEECMDCEQVEDCIENDDATRAAIGRIVQSGSQIPAEFPYGENLPASRRTQDLSSTTNPTCDYDILWSQCAGTIDLAHDAIVDTLEKVEVATNVVELAKAMVSSVPGVAAAEKASGLDGAADLINYFQESVAEGFNAQYTTTPGGVRDTLICALFCACKSDCIITIDRIFAVMETRLQVYLSPPSLTGFVDLIETIAGISVDTTFVVDMAFYVTFGMLKVGNFLFMDAGNRVLDLVIRLKADEPSNDWETLCDDCPVILTAYNVGIFDQCGAGNIEITEFEEGVAFVLNSYEANAASQVVALGLPEGLWNVEVVSTSGTTETNPGDSAYGWFDGTLTFHYALWGTPDFATPETFGTKETGNEIFASWCASQGFNAAWFSETAFTITLVITSV